MAWSLTTETQQLQLDGLLVRAQWVGSFQYWADSGLGLGLYRRFFVLENWLQGGVLYKIGSKGDFFWSKIDSKEEFFFLKFDEFFFL